MPFSRARYVTLCQQSLVTAAVLAVGLSAAGVRTLDIVPAPGTPAETPTGTASGAAPAQPGVAEVRDRTEVDVAPVTPRVREVAVTAARPQDKGQQDTRRSVPGARQSAPEARSAVPPTSAAREARPGFVESTPQQVRGYATVGVTWRPGVEVEEDQLAIEVRTEEAGSWSRWSPVEYHDDHGPDGGGTGAEAARERPGTDAMVIGDVDRVQMRARASTGSLPAGLTLAIVDPGTGEQARSAPAIDTAALDGDQPQASGSTTLEGDGVSDTVSLSAMTRPAKPQIYSRAQWGANERMRDQSAPGYGTVKTGFIHHTVNANNYSSAQVPSLMRGIYAYHTQSRGWRDIGYNFLVDRFGRIWEGRYGGVQRSVVGAHTLGYNEVSFAMSAIGNFDVARPPAAVVAAYARLFAWKLAIYDIRANDPRVSVKGRTMPAINGHRDAGQTACPGRYLYSRLSYVRNRAREIQLAAQKGGQAPAKPAPAPAPAPPTFTSPTQEPQPAKAQPATISFPRSTNLAASAFPDIVLKSRRTGAIRVLPTGGQTGFGGAVQTRGSWWAMSLLTAAGDLTGDGKGDVLARSKRTGLTRVYRGDGAGRVTISGINATRRFAAADFAAAAGDWNRDSKADVLMRTRTSGSLYVIPGTGRGTFGQPRRLSQAWGGYTSTAVAGDLTGDGRPDIVAVKGGDIHVAAGTADGGLAAPVKRQSLGAGNDTLVGGGSDLSGDGVGDVVVRHRDGSLRILTGRRDGTFGPTLGPFAGGAGLLRLSAGQLAGGATPDVMGTNATGTRLVVVPSNGRVNTTASLPSNLRVTGATQVLNAGDWNRDGKSDVITREDGGDTLVLRPGRGDGTFGDGMVMSKGWSSFTQLAALGDVTGDKLPDLVGRAGNGPVVIFPGNRGSGFKAPVLAPASLRTFNQIGSGSWKPGSMPGSAFVGSDGSFVPYAGSGPTDLAGYDWVIGPGDLDGNGVADLVVRDTDGTLWLLPGTSRGYLERRFLAAGYAGYSLGG